MAPLKAMPSLGGGDSPRGVRFETQPSRLKGQAWGPQRWTIAIVAALLLACLIGGGLVAVLILSKAQQARALEQASQSARNVLLKITDDMHVAVMGGTVARQLIREGPSAAAVMNIPKLLSSSSANQILAPATLLKTIALLPMGHLVFNYPPATGELASILSTWDSLAPGSPDMASLKSDSLMSITSGKATIFSRNLTDRWFSILFPVRSSAASKDDTWGWPNTTTGASACSSGDIPGCFDAATNSKWWGQVMLVFNRTTALSNLDELSAENYGYQLTSRSMALPPDLPPVVLASHQGIQQCQSPVVEDSSSIVDDLQWKISVCITQGWAVKWKIPLLVAVVVGPCILVMLLGYAASRWARHSELLKGLLPEPVIRELARSARSSIVDSRYSSSLLDNKSPSVQEVAELITELKQQRDLYTPHDVLGRLQEVGMDKEAAAALMSALVSLPKRLTEQGMRPSSSQDGILSGANLVDQEDYVNLEEGLLSIVGPPKAAADGLLASVPLPATPSPGLFGSSGGSPLLAPDSGSRTFKPGFQNSRQLLGSRLAFLEVDQDELLVPCDEDFMATNNRLNITAGPQPALLDKLEQILIKSIDLKSGFDAWSLNEASRGHPLAALGFWVFNQSSIVKEFKIPSSKLIKFLQTIEAGYNANPYHNATHAADVLQSVHAMLHTGGLRGVYADGFTTMACYIAAIVHDYEHKGVTNDYLINTRDVLAIRYNDRSPQENHHLSAAFTVLSKAELNFIGHFPAVEWVRLRKLIIELVLATDMRQNFSIVGQFVAMHRLATTARNNSGKFKADDTPGILPKSASFARSGTLPTRLVVSLDTEPSKNTTNLGNTHFAIMVPPEASSPFERLPTHITSSGAFAQSDALPWAPCPQPLDEAERLMGLQMMLKCCDLGHACADLNVHLRWVAALEEEMFQQGDNEKKLGLPTSPLCDRLAGGVMKSQVGFFEVVVLPLMTHFSTRFPSAKAIQKGAANNLRYWQQQARVTSSGLHAKL